MTQKERLERLTRLYTIHGDGVARLNMAEAVKDPKFRETVKRLSRIKLDGE